MKDGRLGGVFRFAIFPCAAPCSEMADRIGCQESFRWISDEVKNFERQGLIKFGGSACCCRRATQDVGEESNIVFSLCECVPLRTGNNY